MCRNFDTLSSPKEGIERVPAYFTTVGASVQAQKRELKDQGLWPAETKFYGQAQKRELKASGFFGRFCCFGCASPKEGIESMGTLGSKYY